MGCQGSTEGRPAGAAHGQVGHLGPVDVAVFAMGQGAAAGGENDDAEAGGDGGMNQPRGRKTGQGETPEKERDQDHAATDAEQAGAKTGQGAAGNQNGNDFGRKDLHRGHREKASPGGLACS